MREDRGVYQCLLNNGRSSAQASAELKLGGKYLFFFTLQKKKIFFWLFTKKNLTRILSHIETFTPTHMEHCYRLSLARKSFFF